jgi:hypothetical protein
MSVMKPRTRMISVRFSQEEYSALRAVCSLTGARSISDLTREAVSTVLRSANREDPPGNILDEFRAGMRSLERRVEQLEAKLTTLDGEATQ